MQPPVEPTQEEIDKAEDEELKKDLINDLKSEINEFLFSKIPGSMTMRQFEVLSMDIHSRIFKEWGE